MSRLMVMVCDGCKVRVEEDYHHESAKGWINRTIQDREIGASGGIVVFDGHYCNECARKLEPPAGYPMISDADLNRIFKTSVESD